MKKFESPTLEVEKFEVLDIITTSGGCDEDECWTDGISCTEYI